MRVVIQDNMVDIDGNKIIYADIRNMYENGNGCGLQLTEDVEYKRNEILDLCGEIAERLYKLHDIVGT